MTAALAEREPQAAARPAPAGGARRPDDPGREDALRERHLAQLSMPTFRRMLPALGLGLALALCLWGMQADLFSYMTPAAGFGYALGIVGGSMMLMLLVYPLRKRSPRLRWLGPTALWFRIHMVLGIAGPVLVLFHAQFTFGSTNAALALLAMLIVAGSGLVGRYFYTRIHYGLFGARASLRELELDSAYARDHLLPVVAQDAALCDALRALQSLPARAPQSLGRALAALLAVQGRTRVLNRRVHAALRRQAPVLDRDLARSARRFARAYFVAIRRAAGLQFFERLFRAWHLWHLPLFFMLVITAIVHVIAVHMF